MTHSKHKQWNNRGYLPHFDAANTYQSICYRLADSLPQNKLEKYSRLLKDPELTNEKRIQIEQWLDAGYGSCTLTFPDIAKVIINSWNYYDGERYELINWVIMPNHVHILIKQKDGYLLGEIVHNWKSYSVREINRILSRDGQYWAPDYWDRYIRDEVHFQRVFDYISNNPVKANLVNEKEEWKFSMINYFKQTKNT